MIGKILLVIDLVATGYHFIKEARQDIDKVYQENRNKPRRHRLNGRERRLAYKRKVNIHAKTKEDSLSTEQEGGT